MAMSDGACTSLLLLPVAMLLLQQAALSSADFPLGGQIAVRLPPAPYQPGFAARAVVLNAQGKQQPGFVAAVSAEARAGRYTCSLVVLLGDVKVWASDHVEKFVPPVGSLCRLELTGDGQLRLADGAGTVGWLSGTAGQGVKALHLNRKTGNLVLLDAQNHTRWQSLDDPTDKFLRGQQRRVPSYFIASTTQVMSSAFYSFELDGDKIATYVNFGQTKYSYWELAPRANRTMASARLNGSGLRMLDPQGTTVARIIAPVKKPSISFLALGDDGNLGMYYYDAHHQKFRASYKAMGFCELPLSCSVHEVCSTAGKCTDFSMYADRPERAGNASSSLCNGTGAEECMVHLRGVTTMLRAASPLTNMALWQCMELCAHNLSCNALLYVKDNASVATADHGVCSLYTLSAGAREVAGGSRRYSYWVKLRAGGGGDEDVDDDAGFHGMITKILMICGAIDVFCALVFALLIALYIRRLRKLAAPAAAAAAANEPQEVEAEAVEQNRNDSDRAVRN